jgi:hypothetical protein
MYAIEMFRAVASCVLISLAGIVLVKCVGDEPTATIQRDSGVASDGGVAFDASVSDAGVLDAANVPDALFCDLYDAGTTGLCCDFDHEAIASSWKLENVGGGSVILDPSSLPPMTGAFRNVNAAKIAFNEPDQDASAPQYFALSRVFIKRAKWPTFQTPIQPISFCSLQI